MTKHIDLDALQAHPVDELANFIRSIDGNNSMGAGALAEHICEWLNHRADTGKSAEAWQPIETAPKDGTKVLLTIVGGTSMSAGYWMPPVDDRDGGIRRGIWYWQHFLAEPTHWMPLPAAPSAFQSAIKNLKNVRVRGPAPMPNNFTYDAISDKKMMGNFPSNGDTPQVTPEVTPQAAPQVEGGKEGGE